MTDRTVRGRRRLAAGNGDQKLAERAAALQATGAVAVRGLEKGEGEGGRWSPVATAVTAVDSSASG